MQTYWNPWSLFDELERSLFATTRSPEWPQFDIEDDDNETILTADLPGMSEDDIEVTAHAPYLVVRGERKPKPGRFVRQARAYGAFHRRFWIGEGYDLDAISAQLANGELVIRLEKAETAKPRRIKLASGGLVSRMKELISGDKDKDRDKDKMTAA